MCTVRGPFSLSARAACESLHCNEPNARGGRGKVVRGKGRAEARAKRQDMVRLLLRQSTEQDVCFMREAPRGKPPPPSARTVTIPQVLDILLKLAQRAVKNNRPFALVIFGDTISAKTAKELAESAKEVSRWVKSPSVVSCVREGMLGTVLIGKSLVMKLVRTFVRALPLTKPLLVVDEEDDAAPFLRELGVGNALLGHGAPDRRAAAPSPADAGAGV